MPPPLALTLGEPAGIGPDIVLALWRRRAELGLPPFYVAGDCAFLARRADLLGIAVPLAETEPREASARFAAALPVVPTGTAATAPVGRPSAERRGCPPADSGPSSRYATFRKASG